MPQPFLYVFGVPAGLKELGGVGVAQAGHRNLYTGTLANCLQAVSEYSGDERYALLFLCINLWKTVICGVAVPGDSQRTGSSMLFRLESQPVYQGTKILTMKN